MAYEDVEGWGSCGLIGGAVDWPYVQEELHAWAHNPDPSQGSRWLGLCVIVGMLAHHLPYWESCQIGGAVSILHASYCNQIGHNPDVGVRDLAGGIEIGGWADLVRNRNWFVFEELATQLRLLGDSVKVQAADLPWFTVCDAVDSGDELLLRSAWALTQHDSNKVVSEVDDAKRLCGIGAVGDLESRIASGFRGAAACLLRALANPAESLRYVATAEVAFNRCLPSGVGHARALQSSRWPLLDLLVRVHKLFVPSGFEEQLDQGPQADLVFANDAARDNDGQTIALLLDRDTVFPWVQPISRSFSIANMYAELPWPEAAPTFALLQNEALGLLTEFAPMSYPSVQNVDDSWRTLCLVCVGGTQDPTTSNASRARYAKTPLLKRSPALEKFVDLLGATGRVRLSSVLPGGIIAWHADDGVHESDRMILHVPLQTSSGALNRLGNLIFHMPPRILWLDYSLPHTVYNTDASITRVHLIADVYVRDNADFEQNFLRRMAPELRANLPAAAQVRGANGWSGRENSARQEFTREAASTMVRSLSNLFQDSTARVAFERQTWERVADIVGTR
eukprot:TRINITY_DN15851_c0_g1_i1.p1 TRINITY_DN15851_c0_g1~~TRINITY_DN15851_c0_g1_i1.p1  ORF type:complete len:566 (+),score=67.52 TRINITY_DN15851_c0_g1_i1:90-1787(+)